MPLDVFTRPGRRTAGPRGGPAPATYRCSSCGLVQLRFDTEEERAAWEEPYQGGTYHRERVLAGFKSFKERWRHDLALAQIRIENLTRFARGGRLLDVGASNGALLVAARERGFFPVGIEPDPWAVARAGRLTPGAPMVCATFDEFARDAGRHAFEVVTFIDSLEHMTSPHGVLEAAARLLTPCGLLVIEMPDADAPGFLEQGARWKHFKPCEHAFLWGRRHMDVLLPRHGFRLMDTIMPYPDRRVYYARTRTWNR